jgi:hypothetical protein
MSKQTHDALIQLSDVLIARSAAAAGLVVSIHAPHSRPRSGILWRPGVVVASEQVFPKTETAEIVLADGRHITAKVAGRDRGPNLVAHRFYIPADITYPNSAAPPLAA